MVIFKDHIHNSGKQAMIFLTKLKEWSAWIIAALIGIILAFIRGASFGRSKTDAKIAKAEAEQLRRTAAAIREAEEEGDVLVQNAEARADHHERRDIT